MKDQSADLSGLPVIDPDPGTGSILTEVASGGSFGSTLASMGRIYAPIAYSVVRERQIVPIIHYEAMSLAAWFPVVWAGDEGSRELVVLRTLLDHGDGQPLGSPRTPTSLPLLLRAHPFRLASAANTPSRLAVAVDKISADQPTDGGAPVLLATGKLSRGAELKLRALSIFAKFLLETQAMSRMLQDEGMLTAWPLAFELGGESIAIGGLATIRSEAFEDERLAPFVARFGAPGVELLMAHRLSLFRAGVLLAGARNALKTRGKRDADDADSN